MADIWSRGNEIVPFGQLKARYQFSPLGKLKKTRVCFTEKCFQTLNSYKNQPKYVQFGVNIHQKYESQIVSQEHEYLLFIRYFVETLIETEGSINSFDIGSEKAENDAW